MNVKIVKFIFKLNKLIRLNLWTQYSVNLFILLADLDTSNTNDIVANDHMAIYSKFIHMAIYAPLN